MRKEERERERERGGQRLSMVTSCRERLLFLLGYVFPHDVYEMVRLSELWRFTHFPPMSSQRILQNQ